MYILEAILDREFVQEPNPKFDFRLLLKYFTYKNLNHSQRINLLNSGI